MHTTAILAVTLAALAIWGSNASAQNYVGGPWCAYYGGGPLGGATNCGFYSYEQCMAALSGTGGRCARNTFYTGRDTRRRQRD
jgi:hypothetical protein